HECARNADACGRVDYASTYPAAKDKREVDAGYRRPRLDVHWQATRRWAAVGRKTPIVLVDVAEVVESPQVVRRRNDVFEAVVAVRIKADASQKRSMYVVETHRHVARKRQPSTRHSAGDSAEGRECEINTARRASIGNVNRRSRRRRATHT